MNDKVIEDVRPDAEHELRAVASRAPCSCSAFRIPYDRDDDRYEYIEQGHMFIYPSEKAGWEQIVRHDGMPGEPTSPCFYVWRRARRPNAPDQATAEAAPEAGCSADDPRIYACDRCGRLRNKAEGGNIFTLCDECWDEHFKKPNAPRHLQGGAPAEPCKSESGCSASDGGHDNG